MKSENIGLYLLLVVVLGIVVGSIAFGPSGENIAGQAIWCGKHDCTGQLDQTRCSGQYAEKCLYEQDNRHNCKTPVWVRVDNCGDAQFCINGQCDCDAMVAAGYTPTSGTCPLKPCPTDGCSVLGYNGPCNGLLAVWECKITKDPNTGKECLGWGSTSCYKDCMLCETGDTGWGRCIFSETSCEYFGSCSISNTCGTDICANKCECTSDNRCAPVGTSPNLPPGTVDDCEANEGMCCVKSDGGFGECDYTRKRGWHCASCTTCVYQGEKWDCQ